MRQMPQKPPWISLFILPAATRPADPPAPWQLVQAWGQRNLFFQVCLQVVVSLFLLSLVFFFGGVLRGFFSFCGLPRCFAWFLRTLGDVFFFFFLSLFVFLRFLIVVHIVSQNCLLRFCWFCELRVIL